ncbi:Zinc knuckle CX2CX4HX4C [Trema orientale]|uniref:Zinc knuckle CX2CX4HX4C n=1 Tax=Trema orientale TaxID=63057 RepID=A0A2P5F9Q4_TREOI|nr:Zinc knuckle CX2CX4HX4C [Trema orientale]
MLKLPQVIDELWMEFKYERLYEFCFHCGKLGHSFNHYLTFLELEDNSVQRDHHIAHGCELWPHETLRPPDTILISLLTTSGKPEVVTTIVQDLEESIAYQRLLKTTTILRVISSNIHALSNMDQNTITGLWKSDVSHSPIQFGASPVDVPIDTTKEKAIVEIKNAHTLSGFKRHLVDVECSTCKVFTRNKPHTAPVQQGDDLAKVA